MHFSFGSWQRWLCNSDLSGLKLSINVTIPCSKLLCTEVRETDSIFRTWIIRQWDPVWVCKPTDSVISLCSVVHTRSHINVLGVWDEQIVKLLSTHHHDNESVSDTKKLHKYQTCARSCFTFSSQFWVYKYPAIDIMADEGFCYFCVPLFYSIFKR